MIVAPEPPTAQDVRGLLAEHLSDMYATSPPESVHALDVQALQAAGVTFLTARDDDGRLLGCGALSELPAELPAGLPEGQVAGAARAGEIKSMRTARDARGRGVASAVLTRLVALARERGYATVSLETGSQEYFAAARRLYERHGFVPCGPFGGYSPDPCSEFRSLDLADLADLTGLTAEGASAGTPAAVGPAAQRRGTVEAGARVGPPGSVRRPRSVSTSPAGRAGR